MLRSPGPLPRPFLNSTINRCCKGGHTHGKCTKESESYTSPFARAVHSTFHAFVTEARHSRPRRATVAAVATQASQASLLASNLPVAIMAAIRKPALTIEERETRAQQFFEGLHDPDRLADAMAGLTPQAWVNDVIANMEDFFADAADTDLYLVTSRCASGAWCVTMRPALTGWGAMNSGTASMLAAIAEMSSPISWTRPPPPWRAGQRSSMS